MENTDHSTRFQEIINILISMDGYDVKSSSYSSFINYLAHSIVTNERTNGTEVFISNIDWAFNKVFTMNDEKSCDRLYLIIIDILLNLKYKKPLTNLENIENSVDITFNQIYKLVSQRLHLIHQLSQYKYVLRGQDGYGGRFGAYNKLADLLRQLYSMCGIYSLDDHGSAQGQPVTNISDEQDSLVNIVKSSQTINSIFIMGILSERFSLLRPVVYEKVKVNIHIFLNNPNQIVSNDASNSNSGRDHVAIPGFVFIALNLLSANYALRYSNEDNILHSNESNGNNNGNNSDNHIYDDSFSVDKLKLVIEKLFAAEASPFVWQCGLIFLTMLQTFFKPQKALSLFSPQIVRKVQSLFSESEMSKKICFELCSVIPVVAETHENSGLFNKKAQITTFLTSMASVITDFEGEYSEKMVKFANDRKDDPDFKTALFMFPSKNQLYKSGIILGVSMKIINNNDGNGGEYVRRCFYDYFRIIYESRNETNNRIPSLILQSIPYCVHHGSINESNVDYICNSLMAILCIKYIKNCPIHSEILKFLPSALDSLTNFIKYVFKNFVTHISHVCSVHYLEIMCDFLNKKFADHQSLSDDDDIDYKKIYCVTVATLLRFILANQPSPETKTIFFKFIKMFSSKIGHEVSIQTNNNNENEPIDIPIMHNSVRFISTFIPSNLSNVFLEQSFKLMNDENDLSFAVICAGTPGITASQLKVLVEKVHTALSPELFASFYKGRVTISASESLKNLYEFTKSSTSGWFKKNPPPEFYHCIIETITVILESIKLQEGDMAELMKILEISLPKNEELLFSVRKPAKKMIFTLSVHPDAKPKESFIDKLIGTPMYADSIPGLISKVTVNKNRIKDAVHAWALHTFEDPLARKVNGKFVESIFKYSTDPLILDAIINVLVDYMGSSSSNPSTSENDPINAIELALSAAEIAQQRNIKYSDYSIDLITRCAEYALSPGDELRTSTIRFLINLFNLNNHFSISPTSPDTMNNNPLIYFQKQMSPTDICSVFMSLFTLIFKMIGEGVCLKIFDKSVSSSQLKLSDVMTIRALLAVHSHTFVELRVQPLIKLCSFKASKLDPIVLSQVEKSILFFAHTNTNAFTLFMCQIPMNELTTLCINRLMMKENLRNQFINEYAKILSITSHSYYMKNSRKENEVFDLTNTKCGLYQLLSVISSADINMECMGRILTCILIWLGLFYFNRMLKISSSSFSSELKTISSIFSNLVKTNGGSGGFFSWGSSSSSNSSPLMNDQQIQFVINDLDSFVQCLQMAADQILNSIDVHQFDAFIDTSMNAVSTGSDAAIISIGIVYVQLLRRFSFYHSALSQSFQTKIAEVLTKCFNRTSSQQETSSTSSSSIYAKGIIPTRILAYTLNSSINLPMLNQLSSIHQSHIFKNVLDSCLIVRDRSEFLVKSVFDFTAWLIPNVSENVLNSERQNIPEFASRYFNLSDIEYMPRSPSSPPINPNKDLVLSIGIMDVLSFMVQNGIEFIGKMGKTRLNYVNLLLLMVCSNQRPDIQEKISSILIQLTSSRNEKEMISKLMQNHMDRPDIKALCGNLINMCNTHEGTMVDVPTLTEKYLNMLLCVYNETKSYRDEVSPFHTKVFKIFVRVIAVYGGIKEQDLQEYQKSIVKIAMDALNQM